MFKFIILASFARNKKILTDVVKAAETKIISANRKF